MKKFAAAVSLAMLAGLPLAVSGQTTPCVSCAVARQNAAISSAVNRMTVQQQLQSDLQARLGTQQTTMSNQQALSTLQLQSSLMTNDWAIRQILLQEQLNLLQLQAHTVKKPAASKKKKR